MRASDLGRGFACLFLGRIKTFDLDRSAFAVAFLGEALALALDFASFFTVAVFVVFVFVGFALLSLPKLPCPALFLVEVQSLGFNLCWRLVLDLLLSSRKRTHVRHGIFVVAILHVIQKSINLRSGPESHLFPLGLIIPIAIDVKR